MITIVRAQTRSDTYLSGEHAPVKPQAITYINQLHVCGHLLACDDANNVTGNERSGGEGRRRAVAENSDTVGLQALDRRHDTRRRKFLPRIEGHLEDDE